MRKKGKEREHNFPRREERRIAVPNWPAPKEKPIPVEWPTRQPAEIPAQENSQ